jgi:hypothetical protein
MGFGVNSGFFAGAAVATVVAVSPLSTTPAIAAMAANLLALITG